MQTGDAKSNIEDRSGATGNRPRKKPTDVYLARESAFCATSLPVRPRRFIALYFRDNCWPALRQTPQCLFQEAGFTRSGHAIRAVTSGVVVKKRVALSDATREIFNNAAQAWDHDLYWNSSPREKQIGHPAVFPPSQRRHLVPRKIS